MENFVFEKKSDIDLVYDSLKLINTLKDKNNFDSLGEYIIEKNKEYICIMLGKESFVSKLTNFQLEELTNICK